MTVAPRSKPLRLVVRMPERSIPISGLLALRLAHAYMHNPQPTHLSKSLMTRRFGIALFFAHGIKKLPLLTHMSFLEDGKKV